MGYLGVKTLVGIAGLLRHDVDLLLLDEPTHGSDRSWPWPSHSTASATAVPASEHASPKTRSPSGMGGGPARPASL